MRTSPGRIERFTHENNLTINSLLKVRIVARARAFLGFRRMKMKISCVEPYPVATECNCFALHSAAENSASIRFHFLAFSALMLESGNRFAYRIANRFGGCV